MRRFFKVLFILSLFDPKPPMGGPLMLFLIWRLLEYYSAKRAVQKPELQELREAAS
jgi:hypothetical protein